MGEKLVPAMILGEGANPLSNYIFSKIAKEGLRKGYTPGGIDSRDWFRETARAVSSVSESNIMRTGKGKRLQTGLTVDDIGRMFMFFYDAKTKAKLPYWDRFPLVVPIKRTLDGFIGLNLHYLPHLMRAKLFDALYNFEIEDDKRDSKKLALRYSFLQASSKTRYFKPCLKQYLFDHVRSRFLYIPHQEWDVALFLPTERFQTDSKQSVWKDSRDAV